MRKHVTIACQPCQKEKRKCDGNIPCQRCSEKGLDCSPGIQKKRGRKRNLELLADMSIVLSSGRSAHMERVIFNDRETVWLSLLLQYACQAFKERPRDIASSFGLGDLSGGFVCVFLPSGMQASGFRNLLEEATVVSSEFPPEVFFPFQEEDPRVHIGEKIGPMAYGQYSQELLGWYTDIDRLLSLCIINNNNNNDDGGNTSRLVRFFMPPAVLREEDARSPLDLSTYTMNIFLDELTVPRWLFCCSFSGHLGRINIGGTDPIALFDYPLDTLDDISPFLE